MPRFIKVNASISGVSLGLHLLSRAFSIMLTVSQRNGKMMRFKTEFELGDAIKLSIDHYCITERTLQP